MGYAPEKESLWTPATSGSDGSNKVTNYWIDPAFGKDYDRTGPYILMYSPGDGKDYVEVYRCEAPPSQVNDLIVLLKAYTNGLFEMKSPRCLSDLWDNITGAMRKSHKVETVSYTHLTLPTNREV